MRTFAAIAGGVLIAALAGCTQDSVGPERPSASATASQEKAVTKARLIGLWGADPDVAQERGLPWIRFDHDGEFAGFDGCNSVGGRWVLDAAGRTVSANVSASTLVACPRGEEASFAEMTFDGTRLTYTEGGETKSMRARRL